MTNQITITAGKDVTYAMDGKNVIAFRWLAADRWHVGGPGHEPASYDTETDSVSAFLAIALSAEGLKP